MVKVYTTGNYFYLIMDGVTYEGHAKDVLIHKQSDGDTTYRFSGLVDWNDTRLIPLADLVDESDTPYTENSFTTFYEANTGQ